MWPSLRTIVMKEHRLASCGRELISQSPGLHHDISFYAKFPRTLASLGICIGIEQWLLMQLCLSPNPHNNNYKKTYTFDALDASQLLHLLPFQQSPLTKGWIESYSQNLSPPKKNYLSYNQKGNTRHSIKKFSCSSIKGPKLIQPKPSESFLILHPRFQSKPIKESSK